MHDDRLIGSWRIESEDAAGRSRYGEVVISFAEDGSLTYTVETDDGRKQISKLLYRVDAPGVLVTDQPSAPGEQRTRYEFDASGRLMLDFAGTKSWYVREG
jgi:hypothetical protein